MKLRPFALCLLLACLTACQQSTPPTETRPSQQQTKAPQPKSAPQPKVAPPQLKAPLAELPPRNPADTVDQEPRIPGDYKGNYVWAAATNLAWREMMDSILHGPAQMEDLDASAQLMLDRLNESEFSKRDLDAKSYYVKAGFGSETLTEIKSQMARRFPQINPKLDEVQLLPTNFMAYACLYKSLKYVKAFKPDSMQFQDKIVQGFSSNRLVEQIRIVDYRSDDDFVIQVLLKEERDQLFLCKGFQMGSPNQALRVIEKNKNREPGIPANRDFFQAPKLHLKFSRSFSQLCNHPFLNEGFEGNFIVDMQEFVKFDMDEEGVRAVAIAKEMIKGAEAPEPKRLILDQPYWVILKRRDSPRPYFILGVRNAAMMTPVRKK